MRGVRANIPDLHRDILLPALRQVDGGRETEREDEMSVELTIVEQNERDFIALLLPALAGLQSGASSAQIREGILGDEFPTIDSKYCQAMLESMRE